MAPHPCDFTLTELWNSDSQQQNSEKQSSAYTVHIFYLSYVAVLKKREKVGISLSHVKIWVALITGVRHSGCMWPHGAVRTP